MPYIIIRRTCTSTYDYTHYVLHKTMNTLDITHMRDIRKYDIPSLYTTHNSIYHRPAAAYRYSLIKHFNISSPLSGSQADQSLNEKNTLYRA